MSEKISDANKVQLEGRIYPAIQNCVSNRYKIIVGYIALAGFLISNPDILKSYFITFITFVFTIFIIHNSINYYCNAKEQKELEGKKPPKSWCEISGFDIASSTVMLILIWSGWCLIRSFISAK